MTLSRAATKAVNLLVTGTERDKQTRVGPSELGDLCQRCLGEKLLGIHPREKYPGLAPTIGTAFHAYLENLSKKNLEKGVLVETHVKVGDIENYGPVKGTMDRFDIDEKHGIDYKVMSKKRIHELTSAVITTSNGDVFFDDTNPIISTLKKYYAQLQLYGKGMEDSGGVDVENLSLLLFPRDATTETVQQAPTELPFKYDRSVAENVLRRASEIYQWVSDPANCVDDLESDPSCYYCKYKRDRVELF